MPPVHPIRASDDLDMPAESAAASGDSDTQSMSDSRSEKPRRKRHAADLIAIVGQSARYAGATNLQEYWQNLRDGRNSVIEVPRRGRKDIQQVARGTQ
jgi:hypothetical protein